MQLKNALIKQVTAELFEEHRLAFRELPYIPSPGLAQKLFSGYMVRMRKR